MQDIQTLMIDDLARGRRPMTMRDISPRKTAQTAVICGDSIAANAWSTVGNNYISMNSDGYMTWANALAGNPFQLLARPAMGGKTAQNFIDEQLPVIQALRPAFALMHVGYNDIYIDLVTGAVAFDRIKRAISGLLDSSIVPVWSTLIARSYSSAALLKEHLDLNDRLRRWAYVEDVGIFWDGFGVTVTPTDTLAAIRSGWTYDSAPSVHPNNLGAYYLGKKLAAVLRGRLTPKPLVPFGAEDLTNAPTLKSNVLANPYFAGSGGTAGSNVSGTVPTSWTVDWTTRTGTGTATSAVVDVTDPDTGLAVAKAIQVTIGGVPAANDELRIGQLTGFNTQMSGGDSILAEGVFDLASPANVDRVRGRVQANGNESTWWGIPNQTPANLPEGFAAVWRTQPITVLGAGAASAAVYEARLKFSGDGSGTVLRLYQPRARVGVTV